jgi:hypothetical protein
MKNKHQQHILAAALACALASSTTYAENMPAFNSSLTLAPADAGSSGAGDAGDDAKAQEAELAKKLQNPVASLISVPIQNNWDFGIGPAEAMKYTCNIQPVIPFSISKDWNLITRTIMPVIYLEPTVNNPAAPATYRESHSGLGDITQTFFLSPKEPVGGWILGGGPVLYYPTATDSVLGAGKWGVGPSIVLLQQKNGFTYGALANHIWSYAGWGPQNVNATYLQPFFGYTTKTYTTFTINTESTYNWQAEQWTVPMNFLVQQLVKIGKLPVALQLGYRYYAEKPSGGPEWGLRFAITFLFPKK